MLFLSKQANSGGKVLVYLSMSTLKKRWTNTQTN